MGLSPALSPTGGGICFLRSDTPNGKLFGHKVVVFIEVIIYYCPTRAFCWLRAWNLRLWPRLRCAWRWLLIDDRARKRLIDQAGHCAVAPIAQSFDNHSLAGTDQHEHLIGLHCSQLIRGE